MKPAVVIGLGSPLMGDDGVGSHVAETLAADSRLPAGVEVIAGGTDLLRHAGRMEGQSRVILIDAVSGDAAPGTVAVWDDDLAGLDDRQEHAHHLSLVQAVKLLRMIVPARFTLVGISVSAAGFGAGLSPAVAARVPAIVDRVLLELAR